MPPSLFPRSWRGRTLIATLALSAGVCASAQAAPLLGASFRGKTGAEYRAMQEGWPTLTLRRSFDGGRGVGEFPAIQALDLESGYASAFSFKYPPAAVVAGKHDAELLAFFRGMADHHPVYWTYFHEPEDELYVTRQFTEAEYRAAWRHIHTLAAQVKRERGPELVAHATFIMMQSSFTRPERRLGGDGKTGFYPGDDVVDVFAVDVYNRAARGVISSPAQQLAAPLDFARAHRKPFALAEVGSCAVAGQPQGRATYLRQLFSHLKGSGVPVAFVSYFNLMNGCDYRLDTDEAARKVWLKGLK